jgi:uncharacterized protein YbjT (DUF2867 family)
LVFGATGRQGGSVIRHILKEKEFKVKGFSRSNEQKEFKEKCELIRGNLLGNDAKKVIVDALKGVDAVYAVTDFWDDPKNPDAELKQGHVIMDACKEAGVKHVVFSGLENTKDMSKGEVTCECCDKKFEILEYGKSLGLPITEIRLSFYMENFLHRLTPERRKDGTVVFDKIPVEDKKLDLICAEDIGGIVVNLLKNRDKFIGKTIRVAGDQLTGKEIADTYSRVTGDQAVYEPLPLENFKQKVEYGEIIAKMFKFYQDFSGKLRDIEETKKLYPEVKTFETWLRDTKWKVQ